MTSSPNFPHLSGFHVVEFLVQGINGEGDIVERIVDLMGNTRGDRYRLRPSSMALG